MDAVAPVPNPHELVLALGPEEITLTIGLHPCPYVLVVAFADLAIFLVELPGSELDFPTTPDLRHCNNGEDAKEDEPSHPTKDEEPDHDQTAVACPAVVPDSTMVSPLASGIWSAGGFLPSADTQV